MQLTQEQEKILGIYLEDFRKSEIVKDNNVKMPYESFDDLRAAAIPDLKKMVVDFLNGNLSLIDFKEKSEAISRSHPYWGFKGFSGQMQLNQYVNNIEDSSKEKRLKEAITLPITLEDAVAKINKMAEYLAELKTKTGKPQSIPRVNQSFMLTYFWELQNRELHPVFYGSAKKLLEDIGFDFESQETVGDKYRYFEEIFFAIRSFFEDKKGIKERFPIWFIEHVLWKQFKTQNKENEIEVKKEIPAKLEISKAMEESWIPPIIADLENLALNQETGWSKKKNVKPEKAFETKLRYVFTILGYNVTELGQGRGREPDGIAISTSGYSGYYAVIYDAKAREKEYSIGTGDREIIEYIRKKQRELSRHRVDKTSFLIVSSEFSDSPSLDSSLKDIFRETRVPVILIRAKDLLYIVTKKLSNADIGHIQLEDLFLEPGILTMDKIIDVLG